MNVYLNQLQITCKCWNNLLYIIICYNIYVYGFLHIHIDTYRNLRFFSIKNKSVPYKTQFRQRNKEIF